MATYRVKTRVWCAGHQYEVGDLCDEKVAAALGSDAVLVPEAQSGAGGEEDAPARKSKPIRKASLK